jgi:hypothetical protein
LRPGHPDCVSSFAGLLDSTVRCSGAVPCEVALRSQPAGVQPARRGPTPPAARRDASRPNGEGLAAGIGFLGAHSYPVAAALVVLYGLLILLDSSSITAGAAGSADPERRGATVALHSMGGYAGGFVGLIAIGWIFPLSGGMSAVGWGLAFLHVAAIALHWQVAFMLLGPRDLGGDRRTAARHRGDRA